jgi:hypothetical protein
MKRRRVCLIAPLETPSATCDSVVDPVSSWLEQNRAGYVASYRELPTFEVEVMITLYDATFYESLLEYLSAVPIAPGSVIHQRGWFGKKKNIYLFGF